MSGFKITSLINDQVTRNIQPRPMLTDVNQPKAARQEATGSTASAASFRAALDQASCIQAQLLGSEIYRSYRRHEATRSPRDAARAYGQTRRRPETVMQMPTLQNVV